MESLTEQDVKRMTLPDLRIALRARGMTPAGGLEALRLRLVEYIQAVETGLIPSAAPVGAAPPAQQAHFFDGGDRGSVGNNYSRADGQNLGNFLTDRNTSRVLAPPGGQSSIVFGDSDAVPRPAARFAAPEAPPYVQHAQGGGAAAAMYGGHHAEEARAPAAYVPTTAYGAGGGFMTEHSRGSNNNYTRADGQNLGNFLTDRNSSRVLAPPGGASSIRFGA